MQKVRGEFYDHGITLWSLGTGAGWAADDAYRQVSWVPTLTPYSGAVAYGPWQGRTDSSGGYYITADITIVTNDSYKGSFSQPKVKFQLESGSGTAGTFYRPEQIVDCPDTDEIVIYASRIGENF
jgi:hypothetical protein